MRHAGFKYPSKIGQVGTAVIRVDDDSLNRVPRDDLNIAIRVAYGNLIFIRLHDVLSLDVQRLGAFTLVVPPPGFGLTQEAKKIGHASKVNALSRLLQCNKGKCS
jgi:hypothetical protein